MSHIWAQWLINFEMSGWFFEGFSSVRVIAGCDQDIHALPRRSVRISLWILGLGSGLISGLRAAIDYNLHSHRKGGRLVEENCSIMQGSSQCSSLPFLTAVAKTGASLVHLRYLPKFLAASGRFGVRAVRMCFDHWQRGKWASWEPRSSAPWSCWIFFE